MIKRKSFNLIRQFGLFSFICISLLALVSGYTLSHFLTDKLLWREATVTQEFVNSIVQTDQIYNHFLSWREQGIDPELRQFFQHLANMPDVVKAKVYDADTTVLWASDTRNMGEKDLQNDELKLCLQGNLVTEFGMSRSEIKEEHLELVGTDDQLHFIETYIPVWNSDHSRVLGSIELYKQPRILNDAIMEGRVLVWSIALLGGILLFSTLFWIVFRANRIINAQQEKLIESKSLSMIGETASAVAHAMRNALTSIRGSAELALDADLKEAQESARDIINESDRLNRWTSDLLKFSGDDGDNTQILDLVDLLKEVIREHRLVFEKGNITLATHFGNHRYSIEANAAPLSQVFGNLIMNAVEAMDGGGDLLIRIDHQRGERPTVRIDVIDTGPGLSSEIIGQLFKPFATTKPTGTGLGLALTRRMLSHYDGSITIRSEPGKGVTARVILPLNELQ